MDGAYCIGEFDAGKYYLIAQFLGYNQALISPIDLEKDQSLILETIILSFNKPMPQEIEVTGEKVMTINKVDRQVFDAQAFQGCKGGTATDILRNLRSVSINANGEIQARGASAFVVMIDGKTI